MSDGDFVYIAAKPCGCADAIVVDLLRYKNDTAEFVSGRIKEGYAIERLPRSAGVDRVSMDCPHGTMDKQLKEQS